MRGSVLIILDTALSSAIHALLQGRTLRFSRWYAPKHAVRGRGLGCLRIRRARSKQTLREINAVRFPCLALEQISRGCSLGCLTRSNLGLAAVLSIPARDGVGLLDVELQNLREIGVRVSLRQALQKTLVQLSQWACAGRIKSVGRGC